MSDKNMEKQLAEINAKLDLLTEQMAVQARRQRELEELKDDLSRIGTDLFQTAVTELDEVAHHFDSSDLLYLLKKLLRNTRNISKMVDQIENISDFVTDAGPIGRQAFLDLLATLDEFDRKGYFEFMKESVGIMDNVVSAFSSDDVKLLGENIVTILQTVKNLTQPDMLMAVNNALSVYKNLDIQVEEKISYWDLFKQAKTPEMRRGLAFGIQFMKNLSEQTKVKNNK
ncbi:MAG: DUF1641 domain-containing protein [Calditrichaeota bacterium]|nr:MAG: DUF1641 domain-containing protein [Calditrichota bacterium]